MDIKKIYASKIKNSRKKPTISITITTDKGKFNTSAPAGKSRGKYEVDSYKKSLEGDIKFINKLSAGFGIEYVAAFGIASKLHNVALMPMIAMASALITIVGMFYGAKRYDLLQKIINYAIKKTLIWATVVGLIFFIFAEVFLRIFTTDQNLIDIAAAYMRIDVFTFPLVAITLLIGRAMQGMGTGTPALVFNFMRTILIAIPLAYTLIFIFGFGFLSIPISTIVGAFIVDFIAFAWLRVKIRKLTS